MRTLRAGWLLILGSFLAGCLHPTQAVMSDVDLYDWHEGAVVEVENGDTTSLRDLSLVIRSNRSFRADSIRLELFIETPDSMQFTETVGFPMHHLHRAAALRNVDEIPYRRRVVLDRPGTYRITLTPTARIEGIEAVGINIVKSRE